MYIACSKKPRPCREGYCKQLNKVIMETNLQDSFDKSRNLHLKPIVEERLKALGISLPAIFDKARKLTVAEASAKPPNYKQRNYMAVVMHSYVIGLLSENVRDLLKADKEGRPYLLLGDNMRLYFKKLTPNKYLPSNINTEHVKCLNEQELFENEEKIHVFYAGYVLDDEDWNLEFKEVCISYRNRVFAKESAWVIDLRTIEYQKAKAIICSLDSNTNAGETLVSVPRNQENKKASNQ
jgi:hypothetical protein